MATDQDMPAPATDQDMPAPVTDQDMPAPAAVLCRCPCCSIMENTAFEGDADKRSMELTDVKVHNSSQRHRCEPELCRALHERYLQDKAKMAANPWDRLKTLFLVGIIALLALWVVLYVTFSSMGLV